MHHPIHHLIVAALLFPVLVLRVIRHVRKSRALPLALFVLAFASADEPPPGCYTCEFNAITGELPRSTISVILRDTPRSAGNLGRPLCDR